MKHTGAVVLAACLALAACSASAPVYSDCADARAAGAAPLHQGDEGYRSELDRNRDGVACE